VLGEQVLLGAGVVPVGHGPRTVKHEPSFRQQARAHGLGLQLPPGMKLLGGTGHCAGGAMKHVPSGRQHAPMQGLGVQVLPGAGVEPAGHPPTAKKQAPLVAQQAFSTGIGQLIGPEQVLPGAGVVPAGQGPASVKHVPSGRQQALRHGLGVQVLPAAGVVPCGQALPVKKKHEFRSQHAKTHGLGLHTPPGKKGELAGQFAAVVMKQPAAAVQQAPGHGSGWHVVVPGSVVPEGHGPVMMKQTFRSQQACGGWHGSGLQTPPGK
jgi:hypothetical protein